MSSTKTEFNDNMVDIGKDIIRLASLLNMLEIDSREIGL